MINVALVSSKQSAYSETFIKQHVEKLPHNVFHYYGMPFPHFAHHKSKELNSGIKKITRRIYGKLIGNRLYDYHKALAEDFEREEIDVILCEYGTNGMKLVEVSKMTGIPLVVHFHGYDMYVEEILNLYNNYHELNKYASKIIVVSKHMVTQALQIGIKNELIEYNVYGPDTSFLNAEPQYNSQRIVCIGRFTPKKAQHLVIQSFSTIANDFPESTLHLVGDGEDMLSCKELVAKLGLDSRVIFHGILKRHEIFELLVSALVYVQHSITAPNGDREGTPLSILEAQAAALPVISTNHAGIPDVVLHGQTGYLVDEFNHKEMGRYMAELLSDKEIAKEMGKEARKRILNAFTLERHLKKLAQTLDQVSMV